MRYILLLIGFVLLLLAAFKVYGVFLHPNVGPELMAEATLRVLGAIVLFAVFAKTRKKEA
jgi:hypothetical protein